MARAFSHVKQRSADLLRLNVGELQETGLRTASVTFQPRAHCQQHQQQQQAAGDEVMENVVGQVKVDEVCNDASTRRLDCQRGGAVPVEHWTASDYEDSDDDDADEQEGRTC